MKRIQALVAALVITGVVAVCMLGIGINAALNPNAIPVANSPSDPATAAAAPAPSQDQAQINQMQSLIQQYQAREKQYQAQLNQANTQLQRYQALLQELQRRGIIRLNADGTVQLRIRESSRDDGE